MGLFVSPLVVNVPEQTYSGSITWTASAAPSGSTTHTYEWSLIGGIWVLLRMNLLYGSGGSTATVVTMSLPPDCPSPKIPSGFNAADTNLYVGSGIISTSTSTTGAQVDRCYLR